MGGKQYLAAAEIYETRMNDPNKSMLTYKKAVEMFEAENQEATASKAIEKLATLQMISVSLTLILEVYRTTSPVRYPARFQENVLSGIRPDFLHCPPGYCLKIIILNNRNIQLRKSVCASKN